MSGKSVNQNLKAVGLDVQTVVPVHGGYPQFSSGGVFPQGSGVQQVAVSPENPITVNEDEDELEAGEHSKVRTNSIHSFAGGDRKPQGQSLALSVLVHFLCHGPRQSFITSAAWRSS